MYKNNNSFETFKSELELSDNDIEVFLLIVYNGMMTIDQISYNTNLSLHETKVTLDSLLSKNMILEYSKNLYESFHPKFAIINRYKNLCIERNMQFKKNMRIDNLGTVLTKPYDAARTK